jgi:hypothetical protein
LDLDDSRCLHWRWYFALPVVTRVRPWLPRITARLTLRTRPVTRPRQTWPPSRQARTLRRQRLQAPSKAIRRRRLQAPSKAIRRRKRGAALTRHRTRVHIIRVTESSRNIALLSRRRHCPNTTSRRLPATAISGRPDIGPGAQRVIIGFPAHGWRLPTRALSGLPATGATGITPTDITPATGASTSVTMAASITALAIPDTATRAATGVAATSTTTAQSTM